jgi:hypothetical protein
MSANESLAAARAVRNSTLKLDSATLNTSVTVIVLSTL